MKAFAQLVQQVGSSTKTNDKLRALLQYFNTAEDADKVWTIAIFSGRRPKRFVNTRMLTNCCIELTQTPAWLFEECYHTVGDLAEAIALLATQQNTTAIQNTLPSLSELIASFIALQKADEETRKEFILHHWQQMDFDACFVFNKLITGGFRIGVSQQTMVNALQKATGIDASVLAHRISGNWDPASTTFTELVLNGDTTADSSKPYPFYLAYPLAEEPESLGPITDWQAEWKWDGIRGQVIVRDALYIWSRGEELLTDHLPELHGWEKQLPAGTVLDGEIVALLPNAHSIPEHIGPFAQLQTRINRKLVSKKLLQQSPVGFIAYDVLEWNGEDMRQQPLSERRLLLEQLLQAQPLPGLLISPIVPAANWEELTNQRRYSRDQKAEGLMLKRCNSVYQTGRKVGDWWKWKIDPLTIDAVLIYAQKGHGRRSNLYTDYTFAVRDGDKLVSFTKAYSGLTDKEFTEVDAFVKKHAIEKFGPVRTVKPELVFEIAFEGIAASNRHKSGVALRFPRINRWRKDKPASEINTLDDLKQLLQQYGNSNTSNSSE